jgi:hypothetical protein
MSFDIHLGPRTVDMAPGLRGGGLFLSPKTEMAVEGRFSIVGRPELEALIEALHGAGEALWPKPRVVTTFTRTQLTRAATRAEQEKVAGE